MKSIMINKKEIFRKANSYSFARQYLQDHNITIKIGEEQILWPMKEKIYDIKIPRTQIYAGEQFIEQGDTRKIHKYEELKDIGFVIISQHVNPREKWESGQRIRYLLRRVDETGEHINKIPKDHYIELDTYNRAIRIVGPRAGPYSFGSWISLEGKRKHNVGTGAKLTIKGISARPDELMQAQLRKWKQEEIKPRPINIPEAAFMITDSNEIICFPNTTTNSDMPSILITGMKGCLTDDTLISTPVFPKGIPIKFLLNKGPVLVHSYNKETKKIEPKMCDGAEFAKHADIYELISETGARIKSTSDHPFLLSTGKYKKAINLTLDDELVTVNGLIKLKDITYIGKKDTYDIINVQDNHNFIANGFVVSNSGKSFLLHRLVSSFFWKKGFSYKIAILNDSSKETGTWCYPNNDESQIYTLSRLNEKPLPLPCVYLHPLQKEVDENKLYMGDVGFDVTIPFREVIRNYREYLDLKGSERYFSKITEELLGCKTESQAQVVVDSLAVSGKVPGQTSNKIQAEMNMLFDTKMTNISTHGQLSWSTSKNYDKKYNAVTACVHAGVLPVLETDLASNDEKRLSIYFRYFAGDLFMRQKQDQDFLAEQSELLFVVDEVHNIAKKGHKTGASILLSRCVREGRPRRIGTLLATQKFGELPDIIKDNTTHLIAFKNPGEASKIVSQYNMGKQFVDVIKDLGKHECIAYTTEKFVIYDINGNRRESKLNEVFKGKSIPPYSMHKRPKSDGGD